jgi:hypothetical protein
MPEVVRFYWAGGETAFPLDAIPAEDRNPLRIRRSVLQAHAPGVIEQLKLGKYVAAVWLNGDGLSLVLCHPNLVKGEADTIFANPAMLPRLNIKLGTWDEAPKAVGLFLKAFGGEATTQQECIDARRELTDWLATRAQENMAMVSRQYSNLPFVIRAEPMEVIDLWRKILVRGKKEEIDRFLAEVESRFKAKGWARDEDREANMTRDERQLNRFYCWVGTNGDKPLVMLCLKRSTGRRVRGSTYDVIGDRSGLEDIASTVAAALHEVVEPAAASVGLKVAYPRVGPISRVGPRTAAAMTAFIESGDGRWPLPEEAEIAWRRFVVSAFRDDTALNPDELKGWLLQGGWDEHAASELTRRFYAESALLGEFEEGGQVTWR